MVPAVILAALLSISASAHETASEMAAAANAFLAALSPELRASATYPFADAERENWNYVPIARRGLPFARMTDRQEALALALLRTGLSEAGMQHAKAIVSLELVLKELEGGAARRDPTQYFVTIFGEPGSRAPWGWRFEGHHLSFNFTIIDGERIFFAPSFIGSNPAKVPSGPRQGERVLGVEEDLGRAFVTSLDERQRRLAVISPAAPPEIITANRPRAEPLAPVGIRYADLSVAQQAALIDLTKLYLHRWRAELADAAWARIEASGLDGITFAWAGGFESGQGHYYRIQSPDFLIEFDNTQNGANHIHTTVRDFTGDFGHDLLREHYAHDHAR
jgi:hypothetical protein